jgi:hypothetical protein
MYINTLQSMIRATGGQLKIEAVFPEGRVEINQFRKLKKAARDGLERGVVPLTSSSPPLQKA